MNQELEEHLELEGHVSRLDASKEWISVTLRKPPNDHRVLVIKSHKNRKNTHLWHYIMIARRMNDGWIDDYEGELIKPSEGVITFWRLLPDMPQDILE